MGNLGKPPELKYTPAGKAVCTFSVAVNEGTKQQDGSWENHTTWFKVTVFDKQAELANKKLTKGSKVYIDGKLKIKDYTNKEGVTKTFVEVYGNSIEFIDKIEGDPFEKKGSATDVSDAGHGNQEIDQSDIPF